MGELERSCWVRRAGDELDPGAWEKYEEIMACPVGFAFDGLVGIWKVSRVRGTTPKVEDEGCGHEKHS